MEREPALCVEPPPAIRGRSVCRARIPSGVCQLGATVDGIRFDSALAPQNTHAWQQCPNPNGWTSPGGAKVDTRTFVPAAGSMPLTLWGTNVAGVEGSLSTTIPVDNDPVQVDLSSANSPDPDAWVNHAVTVDAAASAGPSGVGGETCSIDNHASPGLYELRARGQRGWRSHGVVHRLEQGRRSPGPTEHRIRDDGGAYPRGPPAPSFAPNSRETRQAWSSTRPTPSPEWRVGRSRSLRPAVAVGRRCPRASTVHTCSRISTTRV